MTWHQVQHSSSYTGPKYRNSRDCIMKTIRADGPQGLFRGMISTMLREIPGNVAWFGVYEMVCNALRDSQGEVPAFGCILAGASAGVAYWTVPFPADTVKTRIQIAAQSGYSSDTSFLQVLKSIIRTEGVRGLYRGWAVTALRAAPSNAAVFFAYEMCMKAFTGQEEVSLHGHPQHDSQSAQVMPVAQTETLTEVDTPRLISELRERDMFPEMLKHVPECMLRAELDERRLGQRRMETLHTSAYLAHSNVHVNDRPMDRRP